MSVSSTTNKVTYTGTGTTGPFDFDFPVYVSSDIVVDKYTIATGATTTLTETTDYSVTIDSDNTGSVTTVAAVTSAYRLVIRRVLPLTQEIDYVEGDKFPAATHEEGLDRARMVDQQLQEQIDRSVKIGVGTSVTEITLPTPVDGKALLWDGVAGALKNSETDVDDIATAVTAAEAAQTAAEAAQTAAELAETNAEAAAENFEFASKAEAEAGTNETKSMNPLRTAQSIAALQRAIASKADAEAGTDNTKDMTPLRVAEAIAALGSTAAWVDYSATSTVVGFSAFSVKKIRYCKIGNLVVCLFHINGTSDATSLTFTLPNQAKNISPYARCGYGYDNSSAYKHNATAYIDIDSATVIVIAENGASNWTNANNKVVYGQIIYETA